MDAKQKKWTLAAAALVMIALGAGSILRLKASQRLGEPGVRVAALTNSLNVRVLLPDSVAGCVSEAMPIQNEVIDALPRDTSYGRRLYKSGDTFWMDTVVVLMGRDRTSMHDPRFCLPGQGWKIEHEEEASIPIREPHPYDLPVVKLSVSKDIIHEGRTNTVHGFYVYWYVADGALTARRGERMWWMAKELLSSGVLQRWAYVASLSVCLPGQEAETWEKMQETLAAAVPQFQLTTGGKSQPSARGADGRGAQLKDCNPCETVGVLPHPDPLPLGEGTSGGHVPGGAGADSRWHVRITNRACWATLSQRERAGVRENGHSCLRQTARKWDALGLLLTI